MKQSQDYQSVLDHVPAGIFRIDRELMTIFINRRLASFTGWPAGTHSLVEFVDSPEFTLDQSAWASATEAVLRRGEEQKLELRLPLSAGSRHITIRMAPELEDGMVVGLVGVAQDTTGLRLAESALRDSEQRFHAFMDHLPIVAWMKDDEGRYLYASQKCAELLGAPHNAWRGRTDFDFLPADHAMACRDAEREVMRSGEVREAAGPAPDSEGRLREWNLVRFPIGSGTTARMIGGVATDMTERVQLLRALRESEERMKGLMDSSPVLVWMKDSSGRYVYVSRTMEQRFERPLGEWRGRTDREMWPPEVARFFMENDQSVISDSRTHEGIETVPDPDGTLRHWWVLKFPFQNSKGERFVGGVGVDMTERKRIEDDARLQSLTDELTGLYNRRGFYVLAEQEYRVVVRQRGRCALLFVDIDGLKKINDRHGHDAGDRALTMMGEVLRMAVRESDIVARIGGDEFVVFALECNDLPGLSGRVRERLDQYNQHEGLPFRLSAAIGAVEFEASREVSFETQMTLADARMYEVKRGLGRKKA